MDDGDVDLTFMVDPGGITTRLPGRVGPSHGLLAHDLSILDLGIGIYVVVGGASTGFPID